MIFQATWLNTSHDLTKSALFTLLYLSVHCFLEMLVSLTLLLFAIDLTALAHYTTVFPNIPLNCLQQIHNFVSPAMLLEFPNSFIEPINIIVVLKFPHLD